MKYGYSPSMINLIGQTLQIPFLNCEKHVFPATQIKRRYSPQLRRLRDRTLDFCQQGCGKLHRRLVFVPVISALICIN